MTTTPAPQERRRPADGVDVFGEETVSGAGARDDTVRVLICDGHDLVRRSLTASLEESGALEVVAEASDGGQAVGQALQMAPDVVFVSLVLPELTGVQTIGLIAEVMPGIDVVGLAVEESIDERFDALRAGSFGVIDKEELVGSAAAAVERLLRGTPFVDAELAGLLLLRFGELTAGSEVAWLTPSEQVVLERVAAGDDPDEFAQSLQMSVGEASNHLVNVLYRLQVGAPLELSARAREVLARVGA